MSDNDSNNSSSSSIQIIGKGRAIAVTVILIGVLAVTILLDRTTEQSLDMVAHTHEVQRDLNTLLSLLQDLETGQRGYLITGNTAYLEPFQIASASVDIAVDELAGLTSDNINQQINIDRIRPLITAKIQELQQTIIIRRETGFEAALNIVSSDIGKQFMDDIRLVIIDMNNEEQRLLEIRQSDYQNARLLALSMDALAMILMIGIGITVIRRLTEFIEYRNVTDKTLRAAKDIAEEANIAKSEFLSTVSHELRTPLTSIKGAIDMIASGKFGALDPRAEPLIKIAARNSGKLVYLVNDLLDMEKLKSGALELVIKKADLPEIIADSISQINPVADEAGINIDFENKPDECILDCDRNRVGQVITNLLSNAIKFSPKGESVLVRIKKSDASLRVEISDRGPGISKENQTLLFERFSQVDSSDSRSHSGTGLGLAIARAIIDLHGGQIGLRSEPGKGSTFYFELPLLGAPESLVKATEKLPYLATHGQRIIIVEDDTDLSVLMQIALEEEGFEVDLAQNIRDARDLLVTESYMAAVIDINLPDGDGLNLLQEIRKGDNNKNLPVIIVSGSVSIAAGKSKTLAIKNIDWLKKPYDQKDLIALLQGYKTCTVKNPCTVLHIEDDLDLQMTLEKQIGDRGIVTSATSIKQTRALISDNRYDLVILDASLPDGNGLDLISEIKASNGVHAPIVILSGSETAAEIAEQVSAAFLKSEHSTLALVEAIFSYLPSGD